MRSLLATIALLGVGLAVPTAPVHAAAVQAAAATCHGLPASIEASSGKVVGTAGRDVIVVSGSVTRVDAADGDDVVCVVGVKHAVRVSAGAGDDIVNTEKTTTRWSPRAR